MKFIPLFILHFSLFALLSGCTKDKTVETIKTETTTDKQLFEESSQTGYAYYKSGNLLTPAGDSPHGDFKLRINAVGQTVLDASGELPAGSVFPDSSIIVKEVYNGGALSLLAIMKKSMLDANAGKGWVWAEIKPDGTASFSVGNKGDGCISCHSEIPNRDMVRVFDLH